MKRKIISFTRSALILVILFGMLCNGGTAPLAREGFSAFGFALKASAAEYSDEASEETSTPVEGEEPAEVVTEETTEAPAEENTDPHVWGRIVFEYVNFRKTADTSASDNIMCKLVQGELVEVFHEEGNCYKIRCLGQEGYVAKKSVVLLEGDAAQTQAACKIEGEVVYEYVNFRTEPTYATDENIICQIVFGEKVEVISFANGWFKVIYNDEIGYLVGKSVKLPHGSVVPENDCPIGKVVYKCVNFRTEPNTDSADNIICQLTYGAEVDFIAFANGWIQASHNGVPGYLIGDSVIISSKGFPDEIDRTNYGTIVWDTVNFRIAPNTECEILYKLTYGTKVEVLSVEDGWVKIRHDGKVGYITSKSVSTYKIIFDISSFNWGSEFSSIAEFKEFTRRAQENLNFGGYYIQVQRGRTLNKQLAQIVNALDEMKIPYGLYIYTSATTQGAAKANYESYLQKISGLELKYNKFPLMVDLEGAGDQSEVLKFYNRELGDNYIVYSSASDMLYYGYHKEAPQFWLAHYGLCDTLPVNGYTARSALSGYALWQFTDKGNKELLGTSHLDMNIVSDWWYDRYVK